MAIISIVLAAALGGLGGSLALVLGADAALAVAIWLATGALGALPAVQRGLRAGPAQTR